ncbi:hypothetical protein LZC95_49760 [Pendulispora brunnea]|uniref:Alpha-2-macroglobulin domain-containing protein n=1 Tax=Pendulispora brunnea TaxID=2905690 RepID=A0ABZ2KBQ3_9BACT
MNFRQSSIQLFIWSIACSLMAACGAHDTNSESESSPFSSQLAAELGSSTVAIPMPIRFSGSQPVLDGAQRPVAQWDGTTVDLFAADAWAQCASAIDSGADNAQDPYQDYLAGRIYSASCPSASPPPTAPLTIVGCTPDFCPAVKLWAKQRETPACNVDPDTHLPTAVRFYPNVIASSPAPRLPSPNTFTDVKADSPELLASTVRRAQRYVDTASVNLCMAERLREYITTSDSLLLSAEEQRQLLEITRTRAQLAMLSYARIGRALSNTDDRPENTIHDDYQVFPIFLSWGKHASGDASLRSMGAGFAAAIKLHVEATTEEAHLLMRTASARLPRGGHASSSPEEDWGSGSWRQRLLALMYGNNPLSPSNAGGEIDLTLPDADASIVRHLTGKREVPWESEWVTDNILNWPNELPPFGMASYYAKTDASDPRVGVLLGLARSADALLFKERSVDYTMTVSPHTMSVPFRRVDVEPSADQLYRDIEAWIWTQDCIKAGNPTCVILPNDTRIVSPSQFEQSLLFKRHGVTPTHAKTLVSLLSETISRRQIPDTLAYWILLADKGGGPAWMREVEGAMHVTGRHETLTGAALQARIPNATGAWYHLDKNFQVHSPLLEDRAPFFTAWAPYWNWATGPVDEWFEQYEYSNSLVAITPGAMSALSSTSDILRASSAVASNALKDTYFSDAQKGLDLVDGAVGKLGFAIQPQVTMVDEWRYCPQLTHTTTSCPTRAQVSSGDGNKVFWEVTTKASPDDTFYSTGDVKLLAVRSTGVEATAALDANFRAFDGKTQVDYLVNEAVGTATAPSTATLPNGTIKRTYVIALPAVDPATGLATDPGRMGQGPYGPHAYYTFFLTRTAPGQTGTQYRLLARRVGLTVDGRLRPIDETHQSFIYHPSDAQTLPYGGTLGSLAAQAWATNAFDWSKPAYDGFAYPTDWVPPVDPSLYATTNAPNAIAYYLSSARTAADEATVAVKSAVEQLLREREDDATLQSAQKKAQQIDSFEQRALCGDANPNCDTSTVVKDNLRPNITCDNSTPMCQELVDNINRTLPRQAVVARAMLDRSADNSVPAFLDYAGGALQRDLINEWTAYKKLERAIEDGKSGAAARDAAVATAYAELAAVEGAKAAECSKEAMQRARDACWSYQTNGGSYDIFDAGEGWYKYIVHHKKDGSWNPGPLHAQMRACNEATRQLPVAKAKHAEVVLEAEAWVASATTAVLDATGAFNLSNAEILKTLEDTRLAKAKANLEASLSIDNLPTRFGTSRRYHSLDMWRAQALLESARRYATTARRAVEARYLVDLSSMRSDERFVAAPATWADDVYQYDLNAPAAVGLSSRANSGSPTIYANALVDYVQNLTRFVDGYAVSRPTASVSTDADVVTLTGPDVHQSVTVDGQTVSVLADGARPWAFYCKDSGKWITHPATSQVPAVGSLMSVCNGGPPARARLTFSLDPWGRLNGEIVNPPYVARHNVRWKRLAANFVGQGVVDCTFAADPVDCSSKPYIPYDLGLVGPAWVTDFDQQWRLLGVPSGRIEAAKALANQWFDPVTNGWAKPGATAVARQEFDQQPLGGAYTLEFNVPPEVRLDRLKSIQLLTETGYWVKQ